MGNNTGEREKYSGEQRKVRCRAARVALVKSVKLSGLLKQEWIRFELAAGGRPVGRRRDFRYR